MAERRYSIVLELFDHQAPPSHPSPLHPRTASRLPTHLDAQLRSASSRLVLPASNKDFWLPLPATSPLSTLTAPVDSPPPPPKRALSYPRIWSQSSGPLSPPAIPTAQLWTPSQPPPAPTSTTAPATGQQPQLDFRFGPLAIDWVESPTAARSTPMSPSLSAPSVPSEGSASTSTSAPPLQWNPTSPRPSSTVALPKTRSRTPEKSGRTELNWGIIHLFRESGAQADESDEKQKRKAMDEDDGTVVGMVSVPGVLTAASILTFLSPALESVAQLRILR
jgi:BRCA1-associated protein